MIGGTATVTPQHPAHIAFHVNRVEHYPQTQRGLPAHVPGHAMAGITARMEHRVRRLKRDIIHPLAITPAPHAPTARRIVLIRGQHRLILVRGNVMRGLI